VGSRSSLDSDEEKISHHCSCQEWNPSCSAHSLVSVLTELPKKTKKSDIIIDYNHRMGYVDSGDRMAIHLENMEIDKGIFFLPLGPKSTKKPYHSVTLL